MIISDIFYKVSILYEDEVDLKALLSFYNDTANNPSWKGILILFSMLILEMKSKVFLHEPHIDETKHPNSA